LLRVVVVVPWQDDRRHRRPDARPSMRDVPAQATIVLRDERQRRRRAARALVEQWLPGEPLPQPGDLGPSSARRFGDQYAADGADDQLGPRAPPALLDG